MEFSTRNELLASIDESNRTSEEGDTRESGVGTEQIIASEGNPKDGATVRSSDHNLASPDGEEPLTDDIDVVKMQHLNRTLAELSRTSQMCPETLDLMSI